MVRLDWSLPWLDSAAWVRSIKQTLQERISGDVLLLWNERTRLQINQAHNLGDLPLGVLSVTEQPVFADVLTSLQDGLATLSSNSFHHTEEGATHESLVAEREHAQVVVNAIQKVLEAVESGKPLAAD